MLIPSPLTGQPTSSAPGAGTGTPPLPAGADPNGFLRLVAAASGGARPDGGIVPAPALGGPGPEPEQAGQTAAGPEAGGVSPAAAPPPDGTSAATPRNAETPSLPTAEINPLISGEGSGPSPGQVGHPARMPPLPPVAGAGPDATRDRASGPAAPPEEATSRTRSTPGPLAPAPGEAPAGFASSGPVRTGSPLDGSGPDRTGLSDRAGVTSILADPLRTMTDRPLSGPAQETALPEGAGEEGDPALKASLTSVGIVPDGPRWGPESPEWAAPIPPSGLSLPPAPGPGPAAAPASSPVPSGTGTGGAGRAPLPPPPAEAVIVSGSAPSGPAPLDAPSPARIAPRDPVGSPLLTPALTAQAPDPVRIGEDAPPVLPGPNAGAGTAPQADRTGADPAPGEGTVAAHGPVPIGAERTEAGAPIRRLATIGPVAGSVLPIWSRQTGPAPASADAPPPFGTTAEAARGASAGTGPSVSALPVASAPQVPTPPVLTTEGLSLWGPAPEGRTPPPSPVVQTGPVGPLAAIGAAGPLLTGQNGAAPASDLAATPPARTVQLSGPVTPSSGGGEAPFGATRRTPPGLADPAVPVRPAGLTGPVPDGASAPAPVQAPEPLATPVPPPLTGPGRFSVGSAPSGAVTGPGAGPDSPPRMAAHPVPVPERPLADPFPARPEAPPAPTGTGPAPQTGPVEPGAPLSALLADRTALARHVSRQIRPPAVGEVRTQITLRPDGLGAVEVELSTDQNGRLSLLLRVENPTVLQAIRAERDLLLSGLERSGVELDGAQLGFEGFGPGGEPEREPRRGGPYRPAAPLIPDGPEPAPARHRHTPLIGGGRLDLLT